MNWEPLPKIEWIYIYSDGQYVHGFCQICRVQTPPTNDAGFDAFVAQHEVHQSSSADHLGLGDAFAAAAHALGFDKKCSPCEARRRAMNQFAPQFMRR